MRLIIPTPDAVASNPGVLGQQSALLLQTIATIKKRCPRLARRLNVLARLMRVMDFEVNQGVGLATLKRCESCLPTGAHEPRLRSWLTRAAQLAGWPRLSVA
jgi:hypothetical protein